MEQCSSCLCEPNEHAQRYHIMAWAILSIHGNIRQFRVCLWYILGTRLSPCLPHRVSDLRAVGRQRQNQKAISPPYACPLRVMNLSHTLLTKNVQLCIRPGRSELMSAELALVSCHCLIHFDGAGKARFCTMYLPPQQSALRRFLPWTLGSKSQTVIHVILTHLSAIIEP